MKHPTDMLATHPLISDQVSEADVRYIMQELSKVLTKGTVGDIVEFGCYIGTTSLFIRRVLDAQSQPTSRTYHVYDSFEGLPAKRSPDTSAAGVAFQAGELAVSKKQLLHQFFAAGLRAPMIHKGWFDQLTAQDVPEHIAFAFLDGDFYDSILSSLKLVWPRMTPGGLVLVDDYQREALPGVERAIQTFFQGKSMPSITVNHNIARLVVPA